jgi:hypothetical protein
MKCCNGEVLTPYCPNCGKPNLVIEPSQELLRYLNGQLSKSVAWSKKAPDHVKERSDSQREKWSRWIDWVRTAADLMIENERKRGI